MGRIPAVGGGDEGLSPGLMDSAETFAESDVTLGHTSTQVRNESVELINGGSEIAETLGTRGDDVTISGMVINPNTDLLGMQVTEKGTSLVDYYVLERESDGVVLDQTDTAATPAKLFGPLTSGTRYRLYAYRDAGDMDEYQFDNSAPITSTDYDIVDGYIAGSITSNPGLLKTTQAITTETGTVTVEWPYPDDIAGWDMAPFQASQGGEAVKVYVEEYDGSSWIEITGPIEDGADLPADPGRNVRFRVELSREDTANNPTLDAIYRRYVV